MKSIQTTLTRPASVTAYDAGDQVADSASSPTALTFSGAAASAGRFTRVTGVSIVSSNATTTNCDIDLLLFTESPTPSNDNAAYALAAGDVANYRGTISIANGDWGTASSDKFVNKVLAKPGIALVPASGSDDLYGLLVARGAYTPESAEVFTITITTEPA